MLIRGTRAIQILVGLVMLAGLFLASQAFELATVFFVLDNFLFGIEIEGVQEVGLVSKEEALRRFQETVGLEPTGFPDQPTLAALLRAVRDRMKE